MKLRIISYFYMVAVLTAFGQGFSLQPLMAADETSPMSEEDVQVLASGPIHEAFAEAVSLDPEPGIVAPKASPALIDEIPPEHKPEGDVQWIPGYWAWDDERNEYIWVSGIWRVPPPGRRWIPGQWIPVEQGYQWISGYWASEKTEYTEYLPEPPETVEVGPSSNAPSPDYTWIPGSWVWQYGHYVWRPGYWDAVQPDLIWIPSHYNWTPRGYIFVSGYWDYIVIHRGVLFAPVYFAPRIHVGLAFSYSPGVVIDLSILDDALFLRPRYSHYYYGDYYAPRFYRKGIYPWFSLHARRAVYDPIFAHRRWNHRNDRKWEKHLQTRFRERRKNGRIRLSERFAHRARSGKAGRSTGLERFDFVPHHRSGKIRANSYRYKSMNKRERRGFSQRKNRVRTYQKILQNRRIQRQNRLVKKGLKTPGPNKNRFSRSPIKNRTYEKTNPRKDSATRSNAHGRKIPIKTFGRKYGLSHPRSASRHWKDGWQRSKVRQRRSIGKAWEPRNKRGWSNRRSQTFNGRRQRLNESVRPMRRGGNRNW